MHIEQNRILFDENRTACGQFGRGPGLIEHNRIVFDENRADGPTNGRAGSAGGGVCRA